MGVKSTVFEQTLKHKGYFNYSDLYTYCYNWLKDNRYGVSEDEYVEKIAGNGKEINITWVAKRKVTDYMREIITIKWKILGLTDAEVEINGKKEKTNKGDLGLKVAAEMERDYDAQWEKKPFWKIMRGVYDKYIIKTTADEYEDKLTGKGQSFVEEVKAYLNLEGKR
ncbi:hypothetical protein KA107_03325 [Candidatus Pacearchaeota archaeon]|nr:hypothetical protein [Candidatus Pacearchaeota archaeon]